MSKLKSHTADIDVTCSAPWRPSERAPAVSMRLVKSFPSRHLFRLNCLSRKTRATLEL